MTRSRHITALLMGFCLMALPASAIAENGLAHITAAAKLMEQGEPEQALAKISEAFASGKLDSETSAKAFLLRAEANEKLGRRTQALADYTNAMFMGLSAADRAKADSGAKRMRAALGGGEPDSTSAARAAASSETETSSDGGGFNFFGGLFGGSSRSSTPKPAPPAANAWSQGTQITTAQTASSRQAAVTAASPNGAAVADDARQYNILLATLNAEEVAQSEAKRLAKRLGDLLEGNAPEVVQVQKGETVVYRVVSGPFAGKNHSREVCESMKAKGVSCLVVER